MINDDRKLVLVVDTDQRFVDESRPLFAAHRVLTARDLDEAREIVLGGRVDLVVLGPAFGSDVAISQARSLLALGTPLELALVTDVVTNRLLRSALKGGFVDVLDTPLTERDVADLVGQLASEPPVEIEIVVDPSPGIVQAPSPAVVPQLSAQITDVEPAASVSPSDTAVETPASVSTPSEVSFVTEAVRPQPPEPAPTEVPQTLAAATAAAVMPEAVEPPSSYRDQLQPSEAMSSEHPTGSSAPTAPPMAPPVVQPPLDPSVESPLPNAPLLDPVDPAPPVGVLDRVMASPPSTPPPTVAPGWSPTPPGRQNGRGRVIAVMAGKGGSGKTVTATNLAIAIGLRSDPEQVAIVDADLQFGDVALLLQIDPVRTLDDVVDQIDQMSDERLDAVLLRHESGIRVLPAPLLPVRAGEIEAKSVVAVVDRLRSMFATIIVDTGPVFDDGLIMLLEHADQIVTVVDMDLPSVKNAKVALDGLRQVGFDMGRIRLVVNRANSKARLDLVELERSLGLRVGGSIPSDRLVPQSVNEGIPVLALSPRSKVARAFHALAESLEPEATRERLSSR